MNYLFPAIIFYGSYLVFPFILGLFWFSFYRKKIQWLAVVLLLLSLVFIYARFIERYQVVVRHEKVLFTSTKTLVSPTEQSTTVRAVLIADMHLGLYKDRSFLEKVVHEINEQKPDFVLIAGDFIYKINPNQFSFFEPLEDLKVPVFAVAGNHDSKKPGEYSAAEVRYLVEPYGITFIDNTEADFIFGTKNIPFKIYGLSDLWENKIDYSVLKTIKEEDHTIVLVHNPDTAYVLPPNKADFLVAGHTHGGQIRIPLLYKFAIPTRHDFDRGFYNVNGLKVFVTSGLGEIGLPMRFLVPPEIVVLDLEIPS